MKLKTVLLVPLVVGLAAYGAIKGYLHYRVASDLDRLSSMMAPFAELRYDAIATGLVEGSVALEGLRVTPAGATGSITIDRVELTGDGPGFLIGVATGLRPEQPPERLQLALHRVRSPVSVDDLGSWAPETGEGEVDACSLGGLLGQQGLERLGFQQLVADARLRYDFLPRSGGLAVEGHLVQHGLSRGSFEAELSGLKSPGAMAAGVPPQMRRLVIRTQYDAGYLQRALADCAASQGVEPGAYVDRLLAADEATLARQLGFVPGAGLRFALGQMIGKAAELVIVANPGSALNPATLSAYRPQQLVQVLGINLSVNGQAVSDLSFSLPSASGTLADLTGEAVAGGDSGVTAEAQESRPKPPRARFINTPLEELQRYIGRDVRIHTSDRPGPQKGILVALGNGQLDLEQRLYGGKMTVYIPLREIRRVEVYRRE